MGARHELAQHLSRRSRRTHNRQAQALKKMTHPAPQVGPKAADSDFAGRFREIISDPLNLLIERHPLAGYISNNSYVVLHNGNQVPVQGPGSYYGTFSHILLLNRGVHEPLEEYVFQELMRIIPEKPAMLELGAYWAHYSMWLKKKRPGASVYMVEPEAENIQAGVANFRLNQYAGEFIQAFVGHGHFGVDAFLESRKLEKLDILHSDIQGFEGEMLADCRQTLARRAVDYIFVSTHSQALHQQVVDTLAGHGYRVEVSADFDHETTSFDGLVFASSPDKPAVFQDFRPLGRTEIGNTTPLDTVTRLLQTLQPKR
jgi:hypothetical protein